MPDTHVMKSTDGGTEDYLTSVQPGQRHVYKFGRQRFPFELPGFRTKYNLRLVYDRIGK